MPAVGRSKRQIRQHVESERQSGHSPVWEQSDIQVRRKQTKHGKDPAEQGVGAMPWGGSLQGGGSLNLPRSCPWHVPLSLGNETNGHRGTEREKRRNGSGSGDTWIAGRATF